MARILAETGKTLSLSDAEKKIQEVLSVVPGRSSEDASIALHDNDFDVEKAISALLDSDQGVSVSLGWGWVWVWFFDPLDSDQGVLVSLVFGYAGS